MAKNNNAYSQSKQTKFDATSRLEGKIFGSEKITMEGKFSGEIIVKNSLEISQNAKISGSIKADNISIFGKMEGNLETVGSLAVGETAQIHGDIKAGTLEIAAGAIINGQCLIGETSDNQEENHIL